ncbi:unnamed protein product [Rhizophagus irregularis]|nr:unnamed protein product [Rhizophagus irregularis]
MSEEVINDDSEIVTVNINQETTDINLDETKEKILNEQVKIERTKATYWQLYRFASKRDWLIMIIGTIFAIISGAAIPITTVIFGEMINYFTNFQKGQISNANFLDKVNYYALFFVYLAIIVFFSTYIYMAAWVYTGERLTRQIRERYLRSILRQNVAYFDKLGAGEVTTRITSDTHLIQDGISEKVAMSISYAAQFLSAFVIAFIKSWKMTLVICALIPCISITSTLLNKFTAIFMKRSLDYYSKSGTIAEESISTIRTAVAFGIQSKLSKLYDSHLIFAKKEGIKKSILNGAGLGATYFFMYSTYALAFWYGSTLLLKGELTSGDVVNVFFAVLIGAFALGHIAPDLQAFSFAIGAGSKIFETINRIPPIDIASESGEKLDNVEGRIQLKNVSFIYPARPEVMTLKNLSIEIEPGSTVALVGSSGSGKSTIVSLALRFYDPIEGEIYLDGHDIKGLNLQWLRRQMSLVGQEPVLFNTTIAGNVAHGLIGSVYENIDKDKKQIMIEQACRMANAHDFIMNLPDKYETNVGERGFLLSGGQKQRIAIARAIVKDPKILLLDEATSALDTQSEGIVQDALDKASKNRTTIVIAHRLSTIRNATKIVVMNHGVIVESGTHDELMSKKGSYFNLVEAQRIQQAKKAKESTENEDSSDVLVTARNEDIVPEEDHAIGRVITNKSASSAILVKRKADLEAGMKFDYEFTTIELLRKVTKINKPEIPFIILGLFSSIVSGVVYPVFAIIFAKIIQSFSKTGDELRNDAKFWALMFLVIAIVTMISNFIQGSSFGFSGENLTLRIRSMSYAAILRQDISFFDEEQHSAPFYKCALPSLSGLIVALAIGWKLALVCLACIPLLVGSGALRMKMLSGFQQKNKLAYEYSAQIACEGAANIRTVAALTREDDLWNIYHKLLDEPMRQGFNNAFLASITFAFAQCVNFLTNALAFWYGSRLFVSGEYNLEKMFTVFMAIVFGSISAGRVFAFAPDIAKAKSSAATIISLLERNPLIDSWSNSGKKLDKIEGNIKFTDVHFRYPTRPHVRVLRGLNIEIKPGQYAALVGPSGCGKSTTIGLTERFYETTIGKIEIDGIDITKINVSNLREHIALVSQEPSLYDMTIKENVLLGCKPNQNPTQEDIERVCRESNIHDFIVSLPDGYDTRVGATSALDSESEKVVQKALDVAAKGRTTLAIAHRLSTIQHADVIFVIKEGKVAEQGTHQELLAQKGIYFNMVQEQDLGADN